MEKSYMTKRDRDKGIKKMRRKGWHAKKTWEQRERVGCAPFAFLNPLKTVYYVRYERG